MPKRFKHDDDNIPYMTDNMKRALDKGKDLPIEQLVSDKGLAAIEAARARRAAPVHAENLVPISKQAAAQRTQLTRGGPLPAMPATRRVIPRPFQRPRIVVSAHGGHGKTWQSVPAEDIAAGDIIPDLGEVVDKQEVIRREEVSGVRNVATGVSVIVVGAGGNVAAFNDPRELVRVFREAPDGKAQSTTPGSDAGDPD